MEGGVTSVPVRNRPTETETEGEMMTPSGGGKARSCNDEEMGRLWPTEADLQSLGLSAKQSHLIVERMSSMWNCDSEVTPSEIDMWRFISKDLLKPHHPFPVHERLFSATFAAWDAAKRGPPPVWTPTLDEAKNTNLGRLMESKGRYLFGDAYSDPITSFPLLHKLSVDHPEIYWPIVLDELQVFFHVAPTQILDAAPLADPAGCTDDSTPLDKHLGGVWLPGAMLNAAECCLMSGSDDCMAIVWQDEGTKDLHKMSLAELRSRCSSVAFALNAVGFQKGDAIAISMPMTVEAVVIYLGIILAGCVVVSIADSLPSHQMATRVKISDAKAIFTQDVILRGGKVLPLYSRVAEAFCPLVIALPTNGATVTVTLRDCDLAYGDFLQRAAQGRCDVYPAVSLPVTAFSNILFSSGTTGEPKAIPWTHATPIKAAADAWAHQDFRPGDVISWPTNLGWMMGPWLIFAALLNRATIGLFNGSPLHPSFGRFVQEAEVTMLGLIPSIVKSWKNTGCIDDLHWSKIRCFSSSGEPSNATDYLWLMSKGHYAPVIEYCGGTEIGGAYITGSLVQSQALASFSTPAMGCRVILLTDDQDANQSENKPAIGECALLPRVLGSSSCLLNADHYKIYFKDMPFFNGMILRRHGDEIERTAGGYYRAHGRVDDTMNLAGIKVSSVEIERACNAAHNSVVETAAIGISPADGGPEQLVIVAVLKDGLMADVAELKLAFCAALRSKMSPFFKVSDVVITPSLPRTLSNKVMRRIIRDQYRLHRSEAASGAVSKTLPTF